MANSQALLRPIGMREQILAKTTALWRLDEESDGLSSVPRVDARGSLDATDPNTIASGVGHVYARSLDVASTKGLLVSSPAALEFTGTFHGTCWCRPDTDNDTAYILSFDDGVSTGGANNRYRLRQSGTTMEWRVSNGTTQEAVSHADAIAANTWEFIYFTFDNEGDVITVQKDDGTAGSTAKTSGALGPTGNDLTIGSLFDGTAAWGGRIEQLRLGPGLLTAAEHAWLYNSGSGRAL